MEMLAGHVRSKRGVSNYLFDGGVHRGQQGVLTIGSVTARHNVLSRLHATVAVDRQAGFSGTEFLERIANYA
jgi:hypothetical protein